jgi:hypothetical protein
MMMAVSKPKPSVGKVHGPEEIRRGQTVRGRAAGTGRTVNRQFSLFPPEAIGPPGLRYYPEIITPSMEFDLIARIRGLPLVPFQFGALAARRVFRLQIRLRREATSGGQGDSGMARADD